MSAGIGTHRIVALGVALGLLDLLGRVDAAAHLGTLAPVSLGRFVGVAGVAVLALSACRAVRPAAVRLVVPAATLLVCGEVLAARLSLARTGDAGGAPLATLLAVLVFAGVVVLVRDLGRLEAQATRIALAGLLLIAAPLLPLLGHSAGGARILFGAGGVLVSPGELGRPLLLVGVAGQLARASAALSLVGRGWRQLLPDLPTLRRVATLPAAGVLVSALEGDLGPAVILLLAFGLTLALATDLGRYLAAALATTVAAFALGAVLSARLSERLHDVTDPLRFEHGGFAQVGLARLAEAWGGWHGTGLGAGLSVRVGAVPAQGTDYVLALVTAELGLLGLLAMLALLGWLLWACWRAASGARAGFDAAAVVALCALLTVQSLWIAAAALGFLPLTGVTTPLLSAGGSAHVALAVMVGLLVCTRETGEPGRGRSGLALPAARRRRIALVGTASVAALAAIGSAAAATVARQRQQLDRRPDNPYRAWSTLDRGPVLTAEGVALAWTRGEASLDRVARRTRAGTFAPLVGAMDAFDAGTGVERAWGAALRCGGSGQAPIRPRTGAAGALRVVGDPAACEPAGVALTTSGRVQADAARVLGNRPGAVVVLDARSGALLAAVARDARGAADPLALAVAPGSTFKLLTAASALAHGIATSTPLNDGYRALDGGWLANAGGERCGGTLAQALASSCNGSFARIGHALGAARLRAAGRALGFGAVRSLSGLPVAASRVALPDGAADWLLAASAIGQGRVVATPLQMALVGATVATSGWTPVPRLVAATCADGRVLSATAPARRRTLPPAAASVVADAMRLTVAQGTARALAALPGRWAAKTGTAQLPALAQTGTPAGTAGWLVGFPTATGASRTVVALLLLPSASRPAATGGEAADAVAALAPSLRGPLAPHHACKGAR
jgi:cell division protein FtsW (lipid II flippase)